MKKNPLLSLPPLVEIVPVILIIAFFVFIYVFSPKPPTEIDSYTVGCEISQMAYAEEMVSRYNSRPAYRIGVRNDDFAATFKISPEQFAKYSIGEIVEVEVVTWERFNGYQYQTYRIIE